MSTEQLQKYDYSSNKYTPIPGTEDWAEVADLGEGGYEWTEFKAFYSPAARRYFWHGDSGCSCNYWTEAIDTADDFENGDKAALLRAWEAFSKEHPYAIQVADYLDGVEEIRKFRASKATA